MRFQPESELSKWYEGRFGSGSKRIRRIGIGIAIVALARKLLVALWRAAAVNAGSRVADVRFKARAGRIG